MTPFQQAVLNVVRQVPVGKVASYGQVAAYLGMPRGARQVGWAMRSLEGVPDYPWWRIMNNQGQITIKGTIIATSLLQKELLESEGVVVSDSCRLNINLYRWQPDQQVLAKFKNTVITWDND